MLAVLARVPLEEVIGQQHDVRLPLAQRRREDREDGEPVVQVGPERALLDEVLERPVSGRDQPDVDLDRRGTAEPLDFPLLQHAQQLHLRRRAQLADLVEEERAAIGQLEAPFLGALRAGERPALVAEQLRLDQRLRQRGAADLDEGLLGARRVVVDRVRDHLLAGAGLAADQHRRGRAGDLRDLLVDLLNRRAVADDVAERVAVAQLVAEVLVLFGQPVAIGLDQPPHLHRLRDHRRHNAIELQGALVVAILSIRQDDLQRPCRTPGDEDRDADERQFPPRSGGRRERRLLADLRHDDRPARVDHAAGDRVDRAIARARRPEPDTARGFDVQLPARLVEQNHGAAGDLMAPLQQLDERVEYGFQAQRARQRLADFEQRRQPADLVGVIPRPDIRVGHIFIYYAFVTILRKQKKGARRVPGARDRVVRPGLKSRRTALPKVALQSCRVTSRTASRDRSAAATDPAGRRSPVHRRRLAGPPSPE